VLGYLRAVDEREVEPDGAVLPVESFDSLLDSFVLVGVGLRELRAGSCRGPRGRRDREAAGKARALVHGLSNLAWTIARGFRECARESAQYVNMSLSSSE